jgi:hypothetical protein
MPATQAISLRRQFGGWSRENALAVSPKKNDGGGFYTHAPYHRHQNTEDKRLKRDLTSSMILDPRPRTISDAPNYSGDYRFGIVKPVFDANQIGCQESLTTKVI